MVGGKAESASKNDPQMVVAAARELKDRWLEQVNGGLYLPEARGKYEVSRGIAQGAATEVARVEAVNSVPRIAA